ncbi:SDR family NAD(P)-dependent oxidoreductase [Mesorhizobium sp. SARCC-RB16n]|uniref:SDR family NAD(P)-dependent oxidoreductase n=1 Tax=Mesorhizobium sp. SARCC-RB16n TaxID=2116687 RepID=UPI001FEFDAE5|nr:SDR family NAD(P)-dependent oxidoreductase [Mesorhizobium sp. SARCC-RB16n]
MVAKKLAAYEALKGNEMERNKARTGATTRRTLLLGSGVAIATLASSSQASAASSAPMAHAPAAEPVPGPYPTPPKGRSAGPILPGRGSTLSGKVAVVTGIARGIGRAIAVEFAANGADVIALDRVR